MRDAQPLDIVVSTIPPEGLDVSAELDEASVHLDRASGTRGADGFVLDKGGSLRCRVERQHDATVHVEGRLEATLELECGRCLERYHFPLEQNLDLFYLPRRPDSDLPEDEEEIAERDLVVAYYQEDHVDLGEMVREQIFLAIPMKRTCREDCLGICPACGQNRNQTPCECREERVDPRLEPLKKLLGNRSE